MQRMLLALIGFVCVSHVNAFKVENEDGVTIYYHPIDETNVEVCCSSSSGGDYSGVVKIPSFVTYNDKTYNVTRIGQSAFQDCIDLESVIMPETIKSIQSGAFLSCVSLSNISLPSSIADIGNLAFQDCTKLNSIELPNCLKKIGTQAFYGCYSLESVSIPRSVIFIGNFAFRDCNLKTIISYIENPFVVAGVFETIDRPGINTITTLYVPFGTKEAYQETKGWYDFKNIVEMEPVEEGKDITMNNNLQSFCCNQSLDFSGAGIPTAYIASGFSSGEVLLAKVDIVPANTGVILRGVAGQTYKVPFTETGFFYSNLLVGVTEDTTIIGGYVLDGDLFVDVSENQIVNAGEAYLNIPSANGKNQLKIKFTDTITGIEDLKFSIDNSADWYTLQGTRLSGKPSQSGIYLHQGKKVLVK